MSVGTAEIFTFALTDAEELQSRGAVNKTGLCSIITAVCLRGVSQREASLAIMQTSSYYLLLYHA